MFSLLCHNAKPDFPVLANAMWNTSHMTLPDLTLQPTPGEQNKNLILEVGSLPLSGHTVPADKCTQKLSNTTGKCHI